MLTKLKLALRISTSAFDTELNALIADCYSELVMLGIIEEAPTSDVDAQIASAVIYYCKARFGDPDNAERWEQAYRDKLEKLMAASGYGGAEDY